MKKKEFKAESKRLLDLMVNSIYTNKDIFLREIISNASDAIDKLHYISLTDDNVNIDKDEFEIRVSTDKEKRCITISDNGIGMDESELETNLGTICESGSRLFKSENETNDKVDIIGQFGVGFYSAFMVASKIEVVSRKYGSHDAYIWTSEGDDGYTIEKSSRQSFGTDIKIYLKENDENFNYDEYLEDFKIQSIIKKYSDYITYPIKMEITHKHLKDGSTDEYETHTEDETLNSMIPIWKKSGSEVDEKEYERFYTDTFYDYEAPLKSFRNSVEGKVSYTSLLFIPAHAPYDYYQKDYEKGLQLYSNGVLIMDKCSELLPDYFNFVKGLVDSPDVSLNISREILQQDKQVEMISKSIESKIKKELESMLENDRENYIKFFENFGMQLKFGVYNNFGMNKDELKDLLLFHSSNGDMTTLKEYVSRLKENQDKIYYVCGETTDKIDMLPITESFKDKGYELLYLTDYIDEFAMQALREYDGKTLVNIASEDASLETEEDKKEISKENETFRDLLESMKDILKSDVKEVKFTNKLKNHPVCLSTRGNISLEMEKVINAMPTDETIKAESILEINKNHAIADKLKTLYENDKEEFNKYTKVLYNEARLIEGLPIDNPTELTNLICELLAK